MSQKPDISRLAQPATPVGAGIRPGFHLVKIDNDFSSLGVPCAVDEAETAVAGAFSRNTVNSCQESIDS